MKKIDKVFAFVIEDGDEEGVPAFRGFDGVMYPLIGADPERAESLKPMAQTIANHYKKPVTLRIFSVCEDTLVIEPETNRHD